MEFFTIHSSLIVSLNYYQYQNLSVAQNLMENDKKHCFTGQFELTHIPPIIKIVSLFIDVHVSIIIINRSHLKRSKQIR